MWKVVLRDNGVETLGDEHATYFSAYSEYEKAAKKINAKDKDGNYIHPNARISIRRCN